MKYYDVAACVFLLRRLIYVLRVMLFGRPCRRLDDPVGVGAPGGADQIDRSTGGQGATHASGGQMAKGGAGKTGRDRTAEAGNA